MVTLVKFIGNVIHMDKMILAVFTDRTHAEEAVNTLQTHGISSENISVITKENKVEETSSVARDVADGTVGGAVTGGAIGGLAGLLAGAGVIPALAGLLIGGPIAVALGATGVAAVAISGVVTGSLAGGFIGALTSLGLSEDDAKYIDETVTNGGVVVAVPSNVEMDDKVRDVLSSHHAAKITTVHGK